jgi:membrane-bound lytic murein transglycosylase MltF
MIKSGRKSKAGYSPMNAVHLIYRLILIFAFALVLTPGALAQTGDNPKAKPASKKAVRQLVFSNEPWTGDFDQMLERRMIRALVPYSRSLYFNDKGRERGISADNVREFERWINKKYSKKLGKRPLTIYIITTTRDKLLPGVVNGVGDVAIGNLTVTKERLKTVDFVSPKGSRSMNELIVSGPTSPAIASADDLSGRTVHVSKSSSYHESLDALNECFKMEGKSAVKLVFVPEALEDKDMMEMVNAGLLEIIIVDDWKAKMWAQILPNILVNEQAALREGEIVGTAIRKNSPELEAEMRKEAAERRLDPDKWFNNGRS